MLCYVQSVACRCLTGIFHWGVVVKVRLQASEIKKWEVPQVHMILIPKESRVELFVSKLVSKRFSSTRLIFLYCNHFGLIVKSTLNITCLEFLQLCWISAFGCFNWSLKLNFYSIFTLF